MLGLWFSTFPPFESLLIIFGGWGIVTGLTFWAALIKGVTVLARHDEQGRFFGLLDGGRGLVEAILATIAITLFAYSLETLGQSTSVSLQKVIYLYVGFAFVMAPMVLFAIEEVNLPVSEPDTQSTGTLIADLKSAQRPRYQCQI